MNKKKKKKYVIEKVRVYWMTNPRNEIKFIFAVVNIKSNVLESVSQSSLPLVEIVSNRKKKIIIIIFYY